jgi:hypothetical protein
MMMVDVVAVAELLKVTSCLTGLLFLKSSILTVIVMKKNTMAQVKNSWLVTE